MDALGNFLVGCIEFCGWVDTRNERDECGQGMKAAEGGLRILGAPDGEYG